MSTTTTSGGGREGLLAAARAELADHGQAAISLRAVARRAGVSHAAPKHHFHDRAGLLTAVAAEGFDALATALTRASPPGEAAGPAALGRAYIDFGLAQPALFDLMFRPSELHPDDPDLLAAQARAIGTLFASVGRIVGSAPGREDEIRDLTLASWALVHGLVVLARDGVLLDAPVATATGDPAAVAHRLTDLFGARVFTFD